MTAEISGFHGQNKKEFTFENSKEFTSKQEVTGKGMMAGCNQSGAERIRFYKNTAAVEGGITGAGGILLGFA